MVVNIPSQLFKSKAQAHAGFVQVLRQQCEDSFEFFARYFFKVRKGTKFVLNDHHKVIIRDLEDMFHGRVQNLLENCPPRYSKTELCVILFVAWCYVRNPQCEFIHLSYSSPLVMVNSDAIREIIKSKEFQQLWPHIQIRPSADSKQAWETVQGGRFYATHAGGPITGFGAGRMDEWDGTTFKFSGGLLIDDPLKPDDARHETLREATNRRWPETIRSRRNSPRTPTLCIMQRIHKLDFTNELQKDKEFTAPDGDSSRYRHTMQPALIDEGLPTERALWEAKHTVQALKAMRDQKNEQGDVNPVAKEAFDAQYQQSPTPVGGGLIKESWWRFYSDREDVMRRCTAFWITADTAYTEDTANDPFSVQFWGAEGIKRLYLLDRIHGWWEFPEAIRRMTRFWADHPQARRMYIENKASGMSLAQTIKRNRVGDSGSVVLWKPKAYNYPEDKVGRMKEWSHQVHGGVVWLPSPEIAPWVDAFVDEHSEFTQNDTHDHDDDCDGATMAGSVWTKKGGGVRTKLTEAAS